MRLWHQKLIPLLPQHQLLLTDFITGKHIHGLSSVRAQPPVKQKIQSLAICLAFMHHHNFQTPSFRRGFSLLNFRLFTVMRASADNK